MASTQVHAKSTLRRAEEYFEDKNYEKGIEVMHDTLSGATRRHRNQTVNWYPEYGEIAECYVRSVIIIRDIDALRECFTVYKSLIQTTKVPPESLARIARVAIELTEEEIGLASLDATAVHDKQAIAGFQLMWQVYRTIIDVLKYSPTFEFVLRDFVSQACDFIVAYRRVDELLHLAHILVTLLASMRKYGLMNNDHSIHFIPTQIAHIKLRLVFARAATHLDQWQTARRTLEDASWLMEGCRVDHGETATYLRLAADTMLQLGEPLLAGLGYLRLLEHSGMHSFTMPETRDISTRLLIAAATAFTRPTPLDAANLDAARRAHMQAGLAPMRVAPTPAGLRAAVDESVVHAFATPEAVAFHAAAAQHSGPRAMASLVSTLPQAVQAAASAALTAQAMVALQVTGTVTLTDAARCLGLEDDVSAERAVLRAVRAGLVRATIDQVTETVTFTPPTQAPGAASGRAVRHVAAPLPSALLATLRMFNASCIGRLVEIEDAKVTREKAAQAARQAEQDAEEARRVEAKRAEEEQLQRERDEREAAVQRATNIKHQLSIVAERVKAHGRTNPPLEKHLAAIDFKKEAEGDPDKVLKAFSDAVTAFTERQALKLRQKNAAEHHKLWYTIRSERPVDVAARARAAEDEASQGRIRHEARAAKHVDARRAAWQEKIDAKNAIRRFIGAGAEFMDTVLARRAVERDTRLAEQRAAIEAATPAEVERQIVDLKAARRVAIAAEIDEEEERRAAEVARAAEMAKAEAARKAQEAADRARVVAEFKTLKTFKIKKMYREGAVPDFVMDLPNVKTALSKLIGTADAPSAGVYRPPGSSMDMGSWRDRS